MILYEGFRILNDLVQRRSVTEKVAIISKSEKFAILGGPGRSVRGGLSAGFAQAVRVIRLPGEGRPGGCGSSSVRFAHSNFSVQREANSGGSGTLCATECWRLAKVGSPLLSAQSERVWVASVGQNWSRRKGFVHDSDRVSGRHARCHPQQVSDACWCHPPHSRSRSNPIML
jgi:hypothetical protein